jgi:diguanylate cyclase (GGDEF)-like protein/PAS domain S-box-containing protein
LSSIGRINEGGKISQQLKQKLAISVGFLVAAVLAFAVDSLWLSFPVWSAVSVLALLWFLALFFIPSKVKTSEVAESSSLLGALARSSTLVCAVGANQMVRFRSHGELLEQPLDECAVALPALLGDIERAEGGESFMAFYTLGERSYRVHFQPAVTMPETTTMVFVDITQEQERNVELELTSEIFNNTSDAIVVADEHRRIYSVNAEFTTITGFTADEVRGRRLGFPKSADNRYAFYREVLKKLRTEGFWQGDVWSKRKNGEVFSGRMKVAVHRALNGKIKDYVAFFSDITELRKSEEELRYLANHDTLTGLPNRRLFFDRVDQAVKRARRSNGQFAVYFIDLDSFKAINDDLGHHTGDELLKMVADRLKKVVRESDTVARLAGDEFTIVVEQVASIDEVKSIAEKIVKCFDPVFQLTEHEVYASASVGVGIYPTDADDMMGIIKGADTAMYKAKMAKGRGSYFLFSGEAESEEEDNSFFVGELRQALQRDEMELVFQPQVLMQSGSIVGCEALLRWRHQQLGQVMPHRFLPIADEQGLLPDMERWVLQRVCEQMAHWLKQKIPVQFVTLNVSHHQLDDPMFPQAVCAALQNVGLSPEHLIIEVSEVTLLQDKQRGLRFVQALREIGVSVTVDDFGVTRSEFGYLKGLPVSGIKIDNQHLQNIKQGQQGDTLLRAMIGMGEILDIDVVAEGVERGMQEHYLQAAGCRLGQGYLYGKPMIAESFTRLFSSAPEVDLV